MEMTAPASPGAVQGLCKEPGMRLGLQEPFLWGKLQVMAPCFSSLGENTDSWKLSICTPHPTPTHVGLS